METGVAFGASAIAICFEKKKKGFPGKHYGVDPNQTTFYADATRYNLEKENLNDRFELLEGPSHLMLPRLIEQKVTLDFVFVDGWHTFDYTLLDFFLADKMLRKGGMIAFHDMYSPAKQRVLNFILTHRKYRIQKQYAVRGNESRVRTMKFFVWRLSRNPRLLFSWFHWRYQLFNSSGLIVLKKEEDFEPNFDFYKSF
jgi:predicted O-methyltransferase YrrM